MILSNTSNNDIEFCICSDAHISINVFILLTFCAENSLLEVLVSRLYLCKFGGSPSGVAEDLSLLECDTVLLDE
jgi:hypothetical protein